MSSLIPHENLNEELVILSQSIQVINVRCNVTGLSLVEHGGLSGRCLCVAFRATVGGSLVIVPTGYIGGLHTGRSRGWLCDANG